MSNGVGGSCRRLLLVSHAAAELCFGFLRGSRSTAAIPLGLVLEKRDGTAVFTHDISAVPLTLYFCPEGFRGSLT